MAWCPVCGPVPSSDCDTVRTANGLQLRCLSCRSLVEAYPGPRVV
jgi:transcription elongation factor Elf1